MPLVRRSVRPTLDNIGPGKAIPSLKFHPLGHSLLVNVPDDNAAGVTFENYADITMWKVLCHEIQFSQSPSYVVLEPRAPKWGFVVDGHNPSEPTGTGGECNREKVCLCGHLLRHIQSIDDNVLFHGHMVS